MTSLTISLRIVSHSWLNCFSNCGFALLISIVLSLAVLASSLNVLSSSAFRSCYS